MGASGSQDNSEYPFQRDEVARIPFSRDRNNLMPSGKNKTFPLFGFFFLTLASHYVLWRYSLFFMVSLLLSWISQ